MVQGKLRLDTWEKDGETKYKTYINADVVYLGPKPKDAEPPKQQTQTRSRPAAKTGGTPPHQDDIPF